MSGWFFLFISYSLIGAALAGVWSQIAASMPLSIWKRLAGIVLYFSAWPVMIAIDLIEALSLERKFRAARKRGEL
jgi:hypothetical protein